MESLLSFVRTYSNWLITACLIASIFIYAYLTQCGLGMTFDSNLYYSIARSFGESGFWNNLEHDGLESWPPLFPLTIAWFGLDHMRLVNGILLLGTLGLCWAITSRMIQAKTLRVMMMFGIALGVPLYLVHGFLWSEPGFLFLLYLGLYLLLEFRRMDFLPIGLLAILVFNILCLQRHTGVFIVAGLTIASLVQSRNHKQLIWALLFFGLGSVTFWWWNGWISIGTNERIAVLIQPMLHWDFDRYGDNLNYFGYAVSYWVVPYRTNWTLFLVITLGLVALFGPFKWKLDVGRDQTRNYGLLIACFLTYYFLLHLAFTITPDSAERYLSPLYPMFIWLVLMPLDWIPRKGLRSWGWKVTLVFIGLWLAYVATRSIRTRFSGWRDVAFRTLN